MVTSDAGQASQGNETGYFTFGDGISDAVL